MSRSGGKPILNWRLLTVTTHSSGFLRADLFMTAASLATDRARQRAAHARIQQQWIAPFERRAERISPEQLCYELTGEAGAGEHSCQIPGTVLQGEVFFSF